MVLRRASRNRLSWGFPTRGTMPRSAETRGAAASGSRVGEWVEVAVPGRPRLSGRCGRIDAYDDRKRRYVVDLGGERVTLKGSNLKATRSARRCEAAEIESGGRIRAAEPTRRRSGRLPRSDSGDEPPPSRWRRLCFGCVVGSFALAVALYSVYEPTDPTESAALSSFAAPPPALRGRPGASTRRGTAGCVARPGSGAGGFGKRFGLEAPTPLR